jgi:hypothetical protein
MTIHAGQRGRRNCLFIPFRRTLAGRLFALHDLHDFDLQYRAAPVEVSAITLAQALV